MAYLGNQPVVGDSTNTFKLLDNIASFTLTFDATDTAVVSIANDTLSFTNHRFVNGQKVTYTDGGGTAIGGLSDGTSYFIIKVDQNTIKLATSASNAASSTAINLTSGAAGTSHTLNVAFDGFNTKFKATHSNGTKSNVSRAAQISLSVNGVIQQPSEGSSPTLGYSIEPDSTIVFSSAPQNGDNVFGSFIGEAAPSFDITDNTINNFTGDGSTTSFTLSKEIPSSQDVLITLDGVTQYPSDSSTTRAYSVTGQTLTFTSAPADGVAIQARLIGFAGATTSEVTGFYGRTGNAALINTDDISVQNISGVGATFTANVNIGGVLTYEDVTNVDSVGLITARNGISVSGGTATFAGDVIMNSALDVNSTSDFGGNITVSSGNLQLNSGNITMSSAGNIILGDSGGTSDDRIVLGAGSDLSIYHDGTNSKFDNTTGKLLLNTSANLFGVLHGSDDAIISRVDGAVELYYDNSKKLETTTDGVNIGNHVFTTGGNYTVGNNITIVDGGKAKFGTDGDLEIYHSSGINYIDATAGHFAIRGTGNDNILYYTANGDVEIYHDGTKRFETHSEGTYHYGHSTFIIADEGETAQLLLYADDGDDNADKWKFAASAGGPLYLQNYASGSWESNLIAYGEGAIELYHANSKKFETHSGGVSVLGNLSLTNADSYELRLGAGSDLKIHHDGTNSNIHNATGELKIRGNDIRLQNAAGNENYFVGFSNSYAAMYHANTKRIETTSDGAKVSGNQGFIFLAECSTNSTASVLFRNTESNTLGDIRLALTTAANSGSDPYIFFDAGGSNMCVGLHYLGGTNNQLRLGSGDDAGTVNGIQINGSGNVFMNALNSGSGATDVRYNSSSGQIFYDASTRLVKTDIEDLSYGLDAIKQLKPRIYKRTDTDGGIEVGFIADEVINTIPEIVTTAEKSLFTKNEEDTEIVPSYVEYKRLTAVLTKAVQELSARVEELESRQ